MFKNLIERLWPARTTANPYFEDKQPTAVRTVTTEYTDKDFDEALRRCLVAEGILDENQDVPPALRSFTGVGEASVVRLYRVGGLKGIVFIAKRDETLPRLQKEWRVVHQLRRLTMPLDAILPFNRAADEITLYPAVQGLHADYEKLKDFLVRVCQIQDQSGARAVICKLSRKVSMLHLGEPGTFFEAAPETIGQLKDYVSVKPEFAAECKKTGQKVWSHESWANKTGLRIPIGQFEKNPFHQETYEEIANQSPVSIRFGRIHGDFNLTNILVGLDEDTRPCEVHLLDYASSAIEKPVMVDYARFEAELYAYVLPKLFGEQAFKYFELIWANVNYGDLLPEDGLDGRVQTFAALLQEWRNNLRFHITKELATNDTAARAWQTYHNLLYLQLVRQLNFKDASDVYERLQVLVAAACHCINFDRNRIGRFRGYAANDPFYPEQLERLKMRLREALPCEFTGCLADTGSRLDPHRFNKLLLRDIDNVAVSGLGTLDIAAWAYIADFMRHLDVGKDQLLLVDGLKQIEDICGMLVDADEDNRDLELLAEAVELLTNYVAKSRKHSPENGRWQSEDRVDDLHESLPAKLHGVLVFKLKFYFREGTEDPHLERCLFDFIHCCRRTTELDLEALRVFQDLAKKLRTKLQEQLLEHFTQVHTELLNCLRVAPEIERPYRSTGDAAANLLYALYCAPHHIGNGVLPVFKTSNRASRSNN